jgi:CDP-glycerol glycerophosphotransferase (TagB/SpsB family)
MDKFDSVNKLLPFIDVLVTDYSSVYHDFLLLDKPMLFIPYDYNEFSQRIGFKYDYFKNLPGPNITSFEEFLDSINTVQSSGDIYATERRKLLKKIHKYKENESSKRVVEQVFNM